MRRVEASQRRGDSRNWVMDRRARTRHLIELGGLVAKAGLVDLFDDNRATLYGALMELAIVARRDDGANAMALWKRRGEREFEAEITAGNAGTTNSAPRIAS